MLVSVLKSKLHRACVTDANVNYEGSITISKDLMDLVGMLPYERVLVGNLRNGERFETYIIQGSSHNTEVCLNGATAHLGKKGDLLTIMTFALIDAKAASRHKPRSVTLNGKNRPV
jgi:aspartate 1-decarboxylase